MLDFCVEKGAEYFVQPDRTYKGYPWNPTGQSGVGWGDGVEEIYGYGVTPNYQQEQQVTLHLYAVDVPLGKIAYRYLDQKDRRIQKVRGNGTGNQKDKEITRDASRCIGWTIWDQTISPKDE